MVNGGNRKDGLLKVSFTRMKFSDWSVKTDSVFCIQCGKWIYSRCAGVMGMTYGLQEILLGGNVIAS